MRGKAILGGSVRQVLARLLRPRRPFGIIGTALPVDGIGLRCLRRPFDSHERIWGGWPGVWRGLAEVAPLSHAIDRVRQTFCIMRPTPRPYTSRTQAAPGAPAPATCGYVPRPPPRCVRVVERAPISPRPLRVRVAVRNMFPRAAVRRRRPTGAANLENRILRSRDRETAITEFKVRTKVFTPSISSESDQRDRAGIALTNLYLSRARARHLNGEFDPGSG